MSRLYAVGDIHGCLGHLQKLMEEVPLSQEDTVVFIGDYIDRGPDSRGVVDYVLEFRRRHARTVCLMGNHEDMLLDFLEKRGEYEPGVFLYNGGGATLASYGISPYHTSPSLPPEHIQFFRTLKLTHEEGGFFFVHGGLVPEVPLEKQEKHDLLWIRDEFFRWQHKLGLTVVFGHTPMVRIFMNLPWSIGIDTGAVYGGKLTCVELAEREVKAAYQAG